jgi:RNA polymerase sigma-70 factor, ECF subfamily
VRAEVVRKPGVEWLRRILESEGRDGDVPGAAVAAEELVELAVVETAAGGIIAVRRRRRALPGDADGTRAWAFGTAKRVLANHRRGRIRHSTLADRLRAELAIAPVADGPALEVREALAALAEDDRELVILIAWDGFGVAEAGAVLGLKLDASRVRCYRARMRLRDMLA